MFLRPNELIIEMQLEMIHLLEVSLDRYGLPVLIKWAMVPLATASPEDTTALIKEALSGAGIRLKSASLIIDRKDLIVRPEEVPEVVANKATGYPVTAISRVIPVQEVGEIAGCCISTGLPRNGKVSCFTVGVRAAVFESKIAVLEKAGLKVNRVLPATTGSVNVMRINFGQDTSGYGVRIEPGGAELINWIEGRAINSIWIPAWSDNLNEVEFIQAVASGLKSLASQESELPYILVFGSRSEPALAKLLEESLGTRVELLSPWFDETICRTYQTGSGGRINLPRRICAAMGGAAFCPPAAKLRTPKMLLNEIKETMAGVRKRIAILAVTAILVGMIGWWLAGIAARTEIAKNNAQYKLIAGKSNQLAVIDHRNRLTENKLIIWGEALSKAPDWLELLSGIQEALPSGTVLKTVKFDATRDSVIVGTAPDERAVTEFARGLAKVSGVKKAAISHIRAAAGKENVEFAIALIVNNGGAKR